jgi:acyl-coenzyme A synthetase/AMP-(fatty) acid ligase
VPVRIELRDAALPRNANGKIVKRHLKAEFDG